MSSPPRTGRRWPAARSVVAGVTGALAVVALTVTLVAVWAAATVLRPQPVVELATEALAHPEVQAGLAARVTDELAGALDLETALSGVLPSSLERLAGLFASGVYEAVERGLTRALADEDVQASLTRAVARAHDAGMALLRGDGLIDGVSVADGQITLNVLPLVVRGLGTLQTLGMLGDVRLPAIAADGNPDEQIAELGAALGRDLPADFGQLVVYEGEAVAGAQETVRSAQRLLALAKRALWLLVAASVLLVAATLVAARHPSRAMFALALATTAAMVAVRSAVRRVVEDAPERVEGSGARAAVDVIVGGAGDGLMRLAGILGLVGALGVVAAMLIGGRRVGDVELVGAVAAAAATLAVLGFGWWPLCIAAAVGVTTLVVLRRAGHTADQQLN